MTADDAAKAGYEIIWASPFEIGVVKNGVGLKTWWAKDFSFELPGFDHPKIRDFINFWEDIEK